MGAAFVEVDFMLCMPCCKPFFERFLRTVLEVQHKRTRCPAFGAAGKVAADDFAAGVVFLRKLSSRRRLPPLK